jgi:hypothetical protein
VRADLPALGDENALVSGYGKSLSNQRKIAEEQNIQRQLCLYLKTRTTTIFLYTFAD